MLRPRKFSASSVKDITEYTGRDALQRFFRRLSKYPREPRVHSRLWLFGVPGAALALWWVPLALSGTFDVFSGKNNYYDLLAILISTVFMTGIMWYALLYRVGVDENKVWVRFGILFYREVRFSELTGFNTGSNCYWLYSGKKRVRIYYHHYDYALVYMRILEEMKKRQLNIPEKVGPGDANWNERAQLWRNILAQDIFNDHYRYFLSRPDELAYLNSLVQPVAGYSSIEVNATIKPMRFEYVGKVESENPQQIGSRREPNSGSNPLKSKVFSYWRQVLLSGILGLLGLGFVSVGISSFSSTVNIQRLYAVVFLITAVCFGGLVIWSLLYRVGVDEDKIWVRFGKLYYREVWFNEVSEVRLDKNILQFIADDVQIRVNIDRFDYSLAYYGLLRELAKRRFRVDGVNPEDVCWGNKSQIWRNALGERIFVYHQQFFVENLIELDNLNRLVSFSSYNVC